MLAALLVAFLGFMLFAGPVGDQLGELMTRHVEGQIKITIADKDRRSSALQGLSVINDDISDLNDRLSQDGKALDKLLRSYDSKPDGFDRLFASVLARRDQQVNQLWDHRQSMLQHIQAEEWRTIISGARAEMEKEAAT